MHDETLLLLFICQFVITVGTGEAFQETWLF
jgi:hypothetical protein